MDSQGLRGDVFAARVAALDHFGVGAQSFLKVPRGCALEAKPGRLMRDAARVIGGAAIAGAVASAPEGQFVVGLPALGLRGVFGDRPVEPFARP